MVLVSKQKDPLSYDTDDTDKHFSEEEQTTGSLQPLVSDNVHEYSNNTIVDTQRKKWDIRKMWFQIFKKKNIE